MIESFLYPFFVIFLSELFDKTQLIIFDIGLRYRDRFRVFIGALSAHFIMDLIAILIGYFLASISYPELIRFSVAMGFIIIGFFALLRSDKEHRQYFHFKNGFNAAFIAVSVTELGDKTQFASGLLAARFSNIWIVMLGVMAALALSIGLNLFIGSKLAGKLPENIVRILNGLVYVVVGLLMLM